MKAQLPKHQRHSLGTPGCRERGESGEGWGRGTTPPKSDFFFFFICFIMIPTTSLNNLSEFYGTGFEFLWSRFQCFHLSQKAFQATKVFDPTTFPTAVCVTGESDSAQRRSVPRHTLSVCQDMKVKGEIPANKPAEKLPTLQPLTVKDCFPSSTQTVTHFLCARPQF